MELKTLEQKGAYDDLFGYGEKVVRHVRTPAGVAQFKQPIGSVIIGNGRKLDAIKEIDSDYIGWNKYKGKDKREYYVGKDKGKYVVTTPKDEDLSSHDKEEEALDWLNKHAGGSSEGAMHIAPSHSRTARKSAWDGLDIQHKSINAVQTSLINKVNNAMEQKDNATARRYATMLRNDARSNGMRDGGLVDVEKFIEGIG